MDSFDTFKKALKQYLDDRAQNDALFAQAYAKEGKTIDECASFIIGEMNKKAQQGCYVASDEEVFGLAVHYFDEDNLKDIKPQSAQIVSNYKLTDADKIELEQQAKENARAAYLKELEQKEKKAKKAREQRIEKAKKKAAEQPQQLSLFGDLFNQ